MHGRSAAFHPRCLPQTRTLGKCNTRRSLCRAGPCRSVPEIWTAPVQQQQQQQHRRQSRTPPACRPRSRSPTSLSLPLCLSLSLSLSLNTLSLALTLLHTLRALIRPPATLVRRFPSHSAAAASSTSAPPALDSDDKSHRSSHRQRIARHLHICIRLSSLRRCPAPSLVLSVQGKSACRRLSLPPPPLFPSSSHSSPSPGNAASTALARYAILCAPASHTHRTIDKHTALFVVLRPVHLVIVRSLPRRIPWPGRLHRSTSSCLVSTPFVPTSSSASACHTSLLLHHHRP